MTTSTIMVQLANRAWTLEALHCAGTLARGNQAQVALMQMLPVQHLAMLGTEFGYMDYTAEAHAELREYAATIEDYGVPYSLHTFQYATLPEALVDAADYVDAETVFATLPHYLLPYWRAFQLKRLAVNLANHQRQLFTLQHADGSQAAYPRPAHFAFHPQNVFTRFLRL